MPVVVVLLEQPVVYIPRDLHRHPVDFDFLVAPEFPLQALYLQDLFRVDDETESGVVIVAAIYLYFPRLASESSSRRVDFVGKDMLSFQDQTLGTFSLLGFAFGVGFFGAVADEKSHFVINHDGDVESGMGFRSGPELGSGQVPEDMGVGAELLGSMFFPEKEGGDAELERVRGRRKGRRRFKWEVIALEEIQVERMAEEGARPGEGKQAEVGVIETSGEVGVA